MTAMTVMLQMPAKLCVALCFWCGDAVTGVCAVTAVTAVTLSQAAPFSHCVARRRPVWVLPEAGGKGPDRREKDGMRRLWRAFDASGIFAKQGNLGGFFRRIEMEAGERQGVAAAPLAGSQQPATPTASGVWGILALNGNRGCETGDYPDSGLQQRKSTQASQIQRGCALSTQRQSTHRAVSSLVGRNEE